MQKDIIERVTSLGIDFNHLQTLIAVDKGLYLHNERAYGWLAVLAKKGLVSYLEKEYHLTAAGKQIADEGYRQLQLTTVDIINNVEVPEKPTTFDMFSEMHKRLQQKLIDVTGGSKNVNVNGSESHSFLCGAGDLEARITKVMKLHKLKDLDKIERILTRYIVKSYKVRFKSGTRQMKYWILDQDRKSSDLATAYNSWEDNEVAGVERRSAGETFI